MFAGSRIALVTALVALILVVGCTAGGTTGETPQTSPPAEGGATTGGQALVEQKCTQCHTLDRVNAAIYDNETWTMTVERMQGNGLVVTDEEKQSIIDYLTERDASR